MRLKWAALHSSGRTTSHFVAWGRDTPDERAVILFGTRAKKIVCSAGTGRFTIGITGKEGITYHVHSERPSSYVDEPTPI